MPTYEYKCKECGHTEEVFRAPIDSPKRKKCTECGKIKAVRVIASPAFCIH